MCTVKHKQEPMVEMDVSLVRIFVRDAQVSAIVVVMVLVLGVTTLFINPKRLLRSKLRYLNSLLKFEL